jgi:hypothetical protein
LYAPVRSSELRIISMYTPLGRCCIASESVIDCPSWNTFNCSVDAPDDVESKPTGTVTTCCLTYLLTSGSELSAAPSPAVRPDPASDERFKAAGLASRLRGVGGSLETIAHGVSR